MTREETCMTLRQTVFVSRKDVLTAGIGITRKDFDKAVKSGELKRAVFPGRKYGKYERREVLRVFGILEK